MTQPKNPSGPSQEQVARVRESLARLRDDDEADAGTTRDVDDEPDTADPER